MIQLRLSSLCSPLEARLIGADTSFSSVSTDTRALTPGQLFVALRGERFDGHDYLQQAQQQGVAAVLVDREPPAGLSALVVDDTRAALGRLSALWREAGHAVIVAVTGSNGKTTVKEMLAAILREKGEVLATEGNNDIGLPLTLLRLQDEAYGVVEMGANHPGEIAYLSRISHPDVVLLINAGRAHLAGFGDLEGVARAKGEIITGLTDDGWVVLNADDPWARLWRELAGGRKTLSFGIHHAADVSSPRDGLTLTWDKTGFHSRFPVRTSEGEIEISLGLAGEHNRLNALGAIAAALTVGATLDDAKRGLARLRPVRGRLQPLAGESGIHLVDDSYNANPDSVKAAIDVLATAPGRKILVLGGLAEMGEGGEGFYRDIGNYARTSGVELLFALGEASAVLPAFGEGGVQSNSYEDLIAALKQRLRPADRVLVKGSRSAAMERVIAALGGRRST